jgi:hypothetical protein
MDNAPDIKKSSKNDVIHMGKFDQGVGSDIGQIEEALSQS